jgi:uncharacterized membrane protein YeaQ/YmgE (transglycosylase-associated protein family)
MLDASISSDKETSMFVVNWLLAGILTGWATTSLLGTTASEARILNIAVGIAGGGLGFWMFGPILDVGPGFTGFGVIISAVGAALALTIVHFVQQYVLN